MRIGIFIFLCTAILSACANFEEADGATVTFLGASALGQRDGIGGVYVTDTAVLGLWTETAGDAAKPAGGGFGWRKREVIAIPFECKAVFVVETEEQFEQAAALVRELKNDGGDICAIQK